MPFDIYTENEGKFAGVTLALVVLLVVYTYLRDSDLKMRSPVASDGFLPGSSIGHLGMRDDTGSRSGMVGHEPPVFWNAGDYSAVKDYQLGVKDTSSPGQSAEGMYGNQPRAPYTNLSGMTSRFSDDSLAQTLK
jgi:hypothetical protein